MNMPLQAVQIQRLTDRVIELDARTALLESVLMRAVKLLEDQTDTNRLIIAMLEKQKGVKRNETNRKES